MPIVPVTYSVSQLHPINVTCSTRSLHIDSGYLFSWRFSVVMEDIIFLKLFCVYVYIFRSNNNLLYYLRLRLANMLTATDHARLI